MVSLDAIRSGRYVLLADNLGRWDIYETMGYAIQKKGEPAVWIKGEGLTKRSPEPSTFHKNRNNNPTHSYFCWHSDVTKVMDFDETADIIVQLQDAEAAINLARDRFAVMVRLLAD